MQLTPRYDGPPLLVVDGPVGDPAVAVVRQRRRLGELLAGLSDAQWATPSRCSGWAVRDVIAHLVDVDGFWTASTAAALDGTPTRFLTGFDPVATPAALVGAHAELAPAAVLARFRDGVETFAAVLTGLDEAQWSLPAEAPPGHVALHVMARHALWDAWVHERDIAVPLGIDTVVEDDEVRLSLEYAAALSPAFLAAHGSTRTGAVAVDATGPDVRFVVEAGETVVIRPGAEAPAGALHLRGGAVELLEALSVRTPLPPGIAEEDRWLVGGLAQVFDQPA